MGKKIYSGKHETVRVTVTFTREHFLCWANMLGSNPDPPDSGTLLDFFEAIFGGWPPEPGKLPNFVQTIEDSRPERINATEG